MKIPSIEELAQLRARLTDDRGPAEERAAALCAILEQEEPSAEVVRLVTVFVDVMMETGDLAKGFESAVDSFAERKRWLRKQRAQGDAPSTRGRKLVRGSKGLEMQPYCFRSCIGPVFEALARYAGSRPELTAWLVEGAKLWSVEREIAVKALARLGALEAGMPELIRFVDSASSPSVGAILASVLASAKEDARSYRAFLVLLRNHPRACERLAQKILKARIGGLIVGDWPAAFARLDDESRAELCELTDAAEPMVVLLAWLALVGADVERERTTRVLCTLLESELPRRAAELLVSAAVRREIYDERVIAAARNKPFARAIVFNGEHRDEAVLERQGDLWRMPATRIGPWRWVGDYVVAPYHRIRALVPASEWCNDEDELGVLRLSPQGSPTLTAFALPVRFPIQTNGANLAKRQLSLELVHRGDVLLSVNSPFCDSGWGTRNYLFSFNPVTESWRRCLVDEHGLTAAELVETSESQLKSLCFGEAIVWEDAGEPRLTVDGTHYHLDDWERTEEVEVALAHQRHARDAMPHPESSKAPAKIVGEMQAVAGGLPLREALRWKASSGCEWVVCQFGPHHPAELALIRLQR